MDKAYYRKKHLQKRQQMDFKEVNSLSQLIMTRLANLAVVESSSKLLGYMSFNNEVDCHLIQALAKEHSKVYAIPRVLEGHQLSFHSVKGFEDLETGSYGISEPKASCVLVEPGEGDVVIVPGVAFSKGGYRIGYGGGYYDRFMAKYPRAYYIGVCYEHQLEAELPMEVFDCQLDCIVTDVASYMYGKNTQK